MNSELNKAAAEPKLNKKTGGNGKKRLPMRRQERPSVVYSDDELLAVEGQPFWNWVHDARLKSVLESGLVVSIGNHKGGELDVFIEDGEINDKSSKVIGQSLRVYLEDALVSAAESEHPIKGSEIKAIELDLVQQASAAQKNHQSIDAFVVAPIKGGYSLALFAQNRDQAERGFGLRAFLPLGRTSLRRDGAHADVENQVVSVQISELDWSRGNIVVSRRELLAKERKKDESEFFAKFHEGDTVTGVVTSIMPYGAFVNLGAVDGFLHISDISWDKKPRLKELVPIGQQISAQIIGVDQENHRVKLSMKGLNADPWQSIEKSFRPGTEVEGDIVAFADFGAFVKLKDGVEGLIHVGEISWNRIKHPSQKFKIGDHVKAAVLRVDKEARRISLSTKAIEQSPIERLSSQFPIGAVLKTKIASIHDFGMFVELDQESNGLVPRSEISWMRSEEPLDKSYQVGQEIEVAVLGFDLQRQRVSCSIKRLNNDPWSSWKDKFKRGSVHKVKVARVLRTGIECVLDGDLLAFVPRAQLAEDTNETGRLNTKVGDEIEVIVTACDPVRQRVSISQKAAAESETKQAYQSYLHDQGQGGARATLGDAFKKLELNKGKK